MFVGTRMPAELGKYSSFKVKGGNKLVKPKN